MDPTASVHNILFKSRNKCNGDPGNDKASVRERRYDLYMESPNSPRPKEARQVKSKVKSTFIFFFVIKGTVIKEFVLAGQTVNSVYYCDVAR
jgi:hypothetical protein